MIQPLPRDATKRMTSFFLDIWVLLLKSPYTSCCTFGFSLWTFVLGCYLICFLPLEQPHQFMQIFCLFCKKKHTFFYFTHSLLQNTHISLSILHIYSIKYLFFLHFLLFPSRSSLESSHRPNTNPKSPTPSCQTLSSPSSYRPNTNPKSPIPSHHQQSNRTKSPTPSQPPSSRHGTRSSTTDSPSLPTCWKRLSPWILRLYPRPFLIRPRIPWSRPFPLC